MVERTVGIAGLWVGRVGGGGSTVVDAGVAQLVERKPSKLDVAGSSPVSRSWTDGDVSLVMRVVELVSLLT